LSSERAILVTEAERIRLATLAAAEEAAERTVDRSLAVTEDIIERVLLKIGMPRIMLSIALTINPGGSFTERGTRECMRTFKDMSGEAMKSLHREGHHEYVLEYDGASKRSPACPGTCCAAGFDLM